MSAFHSDPARESDANALPDLNVQRFGSDTAPIYDEHDQPVLPGGGDRNSGHAGYYACFAFPGCLPDSEWYGPFESETDAVTYMRANFRDEE